MKKVSTTGFISFRHPTLDTRCAKVDARKSNIDYRASSVLFLALCLAACSSGQAPAGREEAGGAAAAYAWESGRTGELPATDMVLIYGGGAHRDVVWDAAHFAPYVSYTDRDGREQSLFDGFLFLEITNGRAAAPRIFATGYYGDPARKSDWQALVDYYFRPGIAVDALEQCVAAVERRCPTGAKRKVIIALPEPITAGPGSAYPRLPSDYWGEVEGVRLDFTRDADRLAACRWYIDCVRQRFDEGRFQHLELAGFYWVAEEARHTATLVADVAACLSRRKYTFNWIPYWKTTPDYYDWRSLQFSCAYLQPNYFFNESIPYSRLTDACAVAQRYGLDLELEFDARALAGEGHRGYRLRDYMRAFRENRMLPVKRLACYQGDDALYRLAQSDAAPDVELFHEFCAFIVEHRTVFGHDTK
jgi:hypothetical protein